MAKRRRGTATLPPLAALLEPDGPPDIQRAAILVGNRVLRPALVEPTEWRDPADTSSTQARHHGAKIVQGFRHVDTIASLHARSPKEVTKAHVRAVARFRRWYEIGRLGATSAGEANDKVDQSTSPTTLSDRRIEALANLRRAEAALGPQGSTILLHIAVNNRSVRWLASWLETSEHRAHGRLHAALERLAEHCFPENTRNSANYRAAEYSENRGNPAGKLPDIDAAIADIPQERLGRWRNPKA